MLNEELIKAQVVSLAVPKSESLENFVENYFGAAPTVHEDMPADADVEATVLLKLE